MLVGAAGVIVIAIGGDCEIVVVALTVQPLLSVTVTLYVPAESAVAVCVV